MKAPKSNTTREVLSNRNSSAKLVSAARGHTVTSIRVNGKNLYVKNAPKYNPSNFSDR